MYPMRQPGAKYTFETPFRTITGEVFDLEAIEQSLPVKSSAS